MTDPASALSWPQLAALLDRPLGSEAFSPLAGRPLVLVAMASAAEASTADLALCRARLPQLPCPIIGIGAGRGSAAPAWSALVDTSCADRASADTLVRNCLRNPLAAMTLVQLLRHNARADVEDGLLAESLAYGVLQGGAEFRAFLAARAGAPAAPAAGAAPAVLIRESGAGELRITLNRPRQRNAYSVAMRDALVEALQLLDCDAGFERAVIDGAGDCFCVGGELAEFGLAADPATAHAVRSTRNAGRLIHRHAARIECRLHRACIGSGIELPAFAGRVTARADSYFQLPELSMGLVPGAGGTVSIPRRIGRQRAAWMVLSGKRIRAQTALAWGLIDAIT